MWCIFLMAESAEIPKNEDHSIYIYIYILCQASDRQRADKQILYVDRLNVCVHFAVFSQWTLTCIQTNFQVVGTSAVCSTVSNCCQRSWCWRPTSNQQTLLISLSSFMCLINCSLNRTRSSTWNCVFVPGIYPLACCYPQSLPDFYWLTASVSLGLTLFQNACRVYRLSLYIHTGIH